MRRNVLLLLLFLAGTLLALPACARLVAARPDASGEIEIVMTDFAFEPKVIRLEAGQTVHIKLRNEGDKMHEFMAGRDVQIHGDFTEGFGEDFFAGIMPEITGPGMVMGMEGMDMGGMEMEGDDHVEEEGEMEMEGHAEEEGHAGEEDEHDDEEMHMEEGREGEHGEGEGEMEMEDEHVDEEHAAEGEAHDNGAHEEGHDEAVAGRFGAIQMPLMDAHEGLMVMIDPQMIAAGEETTITFTVPEDKVGRWEFGCFQERGQHYDDGMRGIIIVDG